MSGDEIVVGIDASRNRSGGAQVHLQGILTQPLPANSRISRVHLWSYQALLDSIPNQPWLTKHNPDCLEAGVLSQLYWQRYLFPKALESNECQIVLNTDAGTINRFSPSVTMSRDMLSYEPGEIDRFRFGKAYLRLLLLRYMQNDSLKRSTGAVFLTKHAAETIQSHTGKLQRVALIPHGVSNSFRMSPDSRQFPVAGTPVRCVYVSPVSLFKHQWKIVEAVRILRDDNYNIELHLVGGTGSDSAEKLLQAQITKDDPAGIFVKRSSQVNHSQLPDILRDSDIFIFASSCENMPNTLVEAMAAGLPIACSKRGPMPEVLQDGGVYFDPDIVPSICTAISRLIDDAALRRHASNRAAQLSHQFSWKRCSRETWEFLEKTYLASVDKHVESANLSDEQGRAERARC